MPTSRWTTSRLARERGNRDFAPASRQEAPRLLRFAQLHRATRQPAAAAAGGIRPSLRAGDLYARGIVAAAAPESTVTLVDLVSPERATEYWLGFENFYVITAITARASTRCRYSSWPRKSARQKWPWRAVDRQIQSNESRLTLAQAHDLAQALQALDLDLANQKTATSCWRAHRGC